MAANAIARVTIRGFKSIASIENLKLRSINVLVGPNGSGKSNFIGAFGLLTAALDGGLSDYVNAAGGAERLLHFGTKCTKELGISLSPERSDSIATLIAWPTESDSLFVERSSSSPSAAWQAAFAPAPHPGDLYGFTQRAASPRWTSYHFHDTSSSSLMRKPRKVDDNRFLRSDAANLAAFLYYLRERHHDSFAQIRRTVQRVAPFLADFTMEPLRLRPDEIKLEWKHKNSDHYFDGASLSDGTLRFIALATLFLQPTRDRPSLILLDEPELGLHPYAIGLLASLIKQASSETQVIVSTQSSRLVDYFEPDDILVADLVNGATTITRLDSERLAKWLEDYSLGELWEKNEIGGRPGSF